MAAPLAATAPPLARRCADLAVAALPRRCSRLRVELARQAAAGLARLRLARLSSRSGLGGHVGLCPAGKAARVKIGGVLRGGQSACGGFCRALLAACGGSALRASGGGARGNAVRGSSPRAQPRLRSALGLRTRLRASFKSAETADFQRRLSVRAFQGHFSSHSGALGAMNAPRALISPSKRPSKSLQGRLQLAQRLFATRKVRATCFSAA